ncbi:unnamed protein product [Penicillium glandicola]
MGFHKSSMGIKLKDKHLLTAYCKRSSGEATYSELDLNQFLGARKGEFVWGSQNFSESAHDVDLKIEGPDDEPVLHAHFDSEDGKIQKSQVKLGCCIKNEDGHLSYMQCF